MGLINNTTFSVIYENKAGFDKDDLADFAEKIFKAGVITINTTYNPSTQNYQTVYKLTGYFDESVLRKVDMYNKSCRNEEDEFKDMAEKCADTYHTMNGQMEDDNAEEKFEAFNDSIPYDTKKRVPWYKRIFEK